MTRKLAISKFANWILCFCHMHVLAIGDSIKEAISIMKPKQIFISILAVLFVFPLMGTFAQQAANSGSIEVITTFDYPGAGNSTLPQKINERGDVVGVFLSNGTFTYFNFPGALQTTLLSINDRGDFTGDFDDGSGIFQAWVSVGGTITSFSVPGALSTFAYER